MVVVRGRVSFNSNKNGKVSRGNGLGWAAVRWGGSGRSLAIHGAHAVDLEEQLLEVVVGDFVDQRGDQRLCLFGVVAAEGTCARRQRQSSASAFLESSSAS